jgi:UDPglucose--hexose-1-phosphate uridylyltransferase
VPKDKRTLPNEDCKVFLRQDVTNRKLILCNIRGTAIGKKVQFKKDDDGGFLLDQISEFEESCPFCPGNEGQTPEALLTINDENSDWLIRVVPNKYPYLLSMGDVITGSYGQIHLQMEGKGYHELIIESQKHNGCIPLGDAEYMERIINAWITRGREISSDTRIRYVSYFKNHGPMSGGSLIHPHSQIVGLPVFPDKERFLLQTALDYYQLHNLCVYCKVITEELKYGKRVLYENDNFISFAPFASTNQSKLTILPKKHCEDFLKITKEEIHDLADAIQKSSYAIYKFLNGPSFNIMIHTTPTKSPKSCERSGLEMETYFHWSVEIKPRFSRRVSGFEHGTGIRFVFGLPETTVEILKEYLKNNLTNE